MSEKGSISLGALLEQAVRRQLVDFCYLSKELVVLSVNSKRLTFALEEAQLFLELLLHAADQTQMSGEPERKRPGRGSLFSAPAPHFEPPPAAPVQQPAAGTPDDYLDAVLMFAKNMNLIEDYNKRPDSRRVTLYTAATTTELTRLDALRYLTESIIDELRQTGQL